jgi:hypothetical protein
MVTRGTDGAPVADGEPEPEGAAGSPSLASGARNTQAASAAGAMYLAVLTLALL